MSKNRGNNMTELAWALLFALLLAFFLSLANCSDRPNTRGLGGAVGLAMESTLSTPYAQAAPHRTPIKNLSY